MRIVCFFLFFIAITNTASAQKVYFIYLESENSRPFYVKMSDKLYSAGSGYLVLSGLVDSSHQFSVGFTGSKTESRFLVPVSGKDKGFILKSFDYGLGLFDLQNLSVIKPLVDESRNNISYRTRTDDFTNLLAKASNDSSLFIVPIAVKQDVAVLKDEKKPDQKKPEEKTNVEQVSPKNDNKVIVPPPVDAIVESKKQDEIRNDEKKDDVTELNIDSLILVQNTADSIAAIAGNTSNVNNEQKKINTDTKTIKPEENTTSLEAEVYKRSSVKKHAESSTSEGFGLVFYDTWEGGADTIRILIPNPKVALQQPDANKTDTDNVSIIPKDTVQQKLVVAPPKGSVIITKTGCKAVASENDFFKLRKAMAGKTSDDGMVNEAKKLFRSKCFTTDQVKNLGSLFLTSAGKYQFFDAAYLHVTDRDQFASLQSEITDAYYLKRFKALVGE